MTDTDYPEIIKNDTVDESSIDNAASHQEDSHRGNLPFEDQDLPEEDGPGRLSNVELGKKGETAACKFLERKGFEILERNWVCAAGEADIIAALDCEYGSELHFIEVKTRMSTANGFPEEAVTAQKRKRYEQICELYLQQHYCEEARVTFDIISILVTSHDRAFLRMHCNVLSGDCF